MKNKRTVIGVFFLVAVLCLGVGYAVVTDILDIQGVANVSATEAEKAFDQDVYFATAVANVAGDTASVNADNNDKATFTVNSLKGKDDTATFTFTIQNDGDLTANILPKLASNTNSEYFEVKSDWNGVARDLAGGGATETYTVTVKLLKTPTATVGTSISIELTATAG